MSTFDTIDSAALKSMLEGPRPPVLLDVLVPEHFAARHIPGAVNQCVYEVVFLEQVVRHVPDMDTRVVVYSSSRHCGGALDAAEKMADEGYSNIFVLDGGLEGWTSMGFPLEGDPALAPVEPGDLSHVPDRVQIDPQESIIRWTGRNRSGRHIGTVPLATGEAAFAGGRLVGGSFSVDVTGIEDEDLEDISLAAILLAHLRSRDFFRTDLYPTADFLVTSVEPIPGAAPGLPGQTVRGDLILRGVTREIAFPASVERLDDGRVALEAHFDLDRTLWGARYGSGRFFEKLGMHLVHDMVGIQIRLVTRPL